MTMVANSSAAYEPPVNKSRVFVADCLLLEKRG